MGSCLSTGSSQGNGENAPTCCMRMGSCIRKRTSKTFSGHVISLNHLASIPKRIFTNGKSLTSCIYTQQGRKGINQDAMIVWEDFLAEDVTFCGVFDGHGPHGHLVARKVRDALPIKLLSFLHSYQPEQSGPCTACFKNIKESDREETEKNGTAEDTQNSLYREAFLKAYKAMDKELKSLPNLDSFCSGSTAVTLIKKGANLFMGYIGDSRAILGAKDSDDSMMAIQLSVDLKPDLPREADRIKQCKGRVFALQDEPEVPRVWLPFDDAPGLAMARAFGDFCLKEYGVISIPEFSHRVLTERDQFVVLASDGVWDVLSNEEVVQIVSSASNRPLAARIVVNRAAREWKLKYPTSRMDDCAVICLFLDGKMDADSDYDEPGFSSATLQSNHSGNAFDSDDGHKSEPCLHRNFTVRSSDESDAYGTLPRERVGDGEMAAAEDEDWSGLDGVTRVNSLVQLPRFSEEKPAQPNYITSV